MHGARRSGSEASFGFAQDRPFTGILDVKGWPPLKITAPRERLLGISLLRGSTPKGLNWPKTGWHSRLLKDLAVFLEGKQVDWSYVSLDFNGLTRFTRDVIHEMQRIPRGKVSTYGQLAERLKKRGIPAAPQAVGQACGRNPWPLVVPCHRVVAAGGIGGFGWGIKRKRRLLTLEGVKM